MAKDTYSKSTNRVDRIRKQEEGDSRNTQWAELTPQQQINSLQGRPGESKKQIVRIRKKMEDK